MSDKITISDDKLAELICDVLSDLDKSGPGGVSIAINRLKDVGVENGMFLGLPKESYEDRHISLGWYAGQIVSVLEEGAFFAVNSLINSCERFTGLPLKQ